MIKKVDYYGPVNNITGLLKIPVKIRFFKDFI
jgi:hypothetical protein